MNKLLGSEMSYQKENSKNKVKIVNQFLKFSNNLSY